MRAETPPNPLSAHRMAAHPAIGAKTDAARHRAPLVPPSCRFAHHLDAQKGASATPPSAPARLEDHRLEPTYERSPRGARAFDATHDPSLAAFTPLPSILAAPHATSVATTPGSSAAAFAEAVALAERFVTTFRCGRAGKEAHEAHLRLRVAGTEELEVRLRHEHGVISASFDGDTATTRAIGAALEKALSQYGVVVEAPSSRSDLPR